MSKLILVIAAVIALQGCATRSERIREKCAGDEVCIQKAEADYMRRLQQAALIQQIMPKPQATQPIQCRWVQINNTAYCQ